ncbi:MAG TPA: DUF58 domain-containing protein [Verrucomicrobiae bacterium]|nr:DUF58 domain-containing protein [Verrucomicrobiae bacterium]
MIADFQSRLRRVEVRSRLISQELMAGQSDSIFKGRGMEFVDVREYTPGDDVRRIDWNVSARLRKTYIKRLIEERELTVLLLVDLSASGHFGTSGATKRELAAELAGTLALSAIRNADRVGLILFTSEVEHYISPGKTRKHVQRLLRDLLTHTPRHEGTNIDSALKFAARVTHRPALLFLISDLHDDNFGMALKAANQRHDVLALQVIDPRETVLPDVGWALVRDAESCEVLEVDTSDAEVRMAYRSAALNRQTEMRRFFQGARIGHLEIIMGDSTRPWPNALRTFLAQHARRRVA